LGIRYWVLAQSLAKKTVGLIEKETKVLEIPYLKHLLILKLGQINHKYQCVVKKKKILKTG
jgi:hypothetical protein